MAKGKHSTALFEVIHNARRPERAAQSLRTPKWWFKGRPEGSGAAEPREATTTVAEPEVVSEPTPPPPARPAAAPRSSRHPRSSAVHVEFDRERQEITLRLRYTTAIVSAFSVCVLVALAYVVGRHISRGPQTASASDGQQISRLREQPPQQGVTDLPHRHHAAPPQQASIPNDPPTRVIEQQPASRSRGPATQAPAGVESRLPRTVNLNYVVIQTYPRERLEAAQQARDTFIRNGIPCTIVSLESHRSEWVQLVGAAGFQHIRGADYRNYVESITAVWEKSGGAKFDQFKPYGYKWKGTETPVE
jgi:hypothetical protein